MFVGKADDRKLTVSIFLIIISFLLLMTGISFAWFAANDSAIRRSLGNYNVETAVSTDGVTWQPGSNAVDLSSISKGDITARIKLKNHDKRGYDVSLKMHSPLTVLGSETPKLVTAEDTAKYYYLGSQIKISEIKTDEASLEKSAAPALGKFLVETGSDGSGQVPFVTSEITEIPTLFVLDSYHLRGEESVVFSLKFSFTAPASIAEYQNFDGNCSRVFALVFND